LLNGRLKAAIECLLFVAEEPLPAARVAEVLEEDEATVAQALQEMSMDGDGRGVMVEKVAGGYRLLSKPEFAEYVARLRNPRPAKLSRSLLETLTIIAYRQPITRPEVDFFRGVDSSYAIEALVDLGLVEEAGRKDAPGRPFLYRTTRRFLELFGLNDLKDLPPLPGAGLQAPLLDATLQPVADSSN